jgi:hypothetical protein
MYIVLFFNILLILLAAGVLTQVIPTRLFDPLIELLHGTVGISTPPPKSIRVAVVIWIAATLVIVDGMIYLMAYVF